MKYISHYPEQLQDQIKMLIEKDKLGVYLSKKCPTNHTINSDKTLGTHTFVSRVQGGKLKSKNIIKIATIFKDVPEEFLQMIVVHELAHFKEKEHNKAFYKFCEYMQKDYHQVEFDLRVYLLHLDLKGKK